jgi:hypothetical protein
MTTLSKWIAAIALWLFFGMLLGLIYAAARPKVATASFGGLAALSYAILITVLFFRRRTL